MIRTDMFKIGEPAEILKTTCVSLVVLLLSFVIVVPHAHSGPIFMYYPDKSAEDRIVKDGEILTTPSGKGWRALTTQLEEVETDVQDAIDRENVAVDPVQGTIEFLLERTEPEGDTVQYEALAALADPSVQAEYPFEVVFYVEWNSDFDGNPVLFVNSRGEGIAKTGQVWGSIIPFSVPVDPGDKIHVRVTWGPDGPDSNRVFFNGVEAAHYYIEGSDTESPRTGNLSAFLPNVVHLKIGNSLQSPLAGTILYGLVLHDSILSPDLPFGYGLPEIKSVSHDGFKIAGYSGKLVEGDSITVTMEADPDGVATFDLGTIKDHTMSESQKTPGTYTGTHIIKYDEEVEDGQVVGHFVNASGLAAAPVAAQRTVTLDPKIYLLVQSDMDLLAADEGSQAEITVRAADANGKPIRDHELQLTLSTTDEYTGTVGGGTFAEQVGGQVEVDWGGVTDSFGEVTAQYVSGFAAKTILVSAKDMVTGDVGIGYVRSFIEGTVDIVVKSASARAMAVGGSMEVTASRDWLTADGVSRSRITAVVTDASGNPVQGNNIQFNLLGDNGKIRVVKGRTDSKGHATADYIAGTKIGLVQIQIQDLTSGLSSLVSIELRSDAPAEISLTADPPEVFAGDRRGSVVSAKVTDVNGNPNTDTEVLFEVITGAGTVSASSVLTDGSEGREGVAEVTFLPGDSPGVATIEATVTSRTPTEDEVDAAEGAVFLYGLEKEPVRLKVVEWLVEEDTEVTKGQDLVVLEDRADTTYTLRSPRDGIMSVFTSEEDDRVEYGQTLVYVLTKPE